VQSINLDSCNKWFEYNIIDDPLFNQSNECCPVLGKADYFFFGMLFKKHFILKREGKIKEKNKNGQPTLPVQIWNMVIEELATRQIRNTECL